MTYDEQMKIAEKIMAERRELLAKLDDTVPYRKSRKGRKPFVVECRYTGVKRWPWHNDLWKVWQRYKTEKARDEALRTLQRKRSHWNGVSLTHYEYRKGEGK